MFLRSEKYEEALKMLEKASTSNPEHVESRYNSGVVMMRMNRTQKASAMFKSALKIDSSHSSSRYNLALLHLQADDLDSAEVLFRELLLSEPSHARSLYNLGLIHMRKNRDADAIPFFKKAIELRGDYPEAKYNIALCLKRQKRVEDALDVIQSALEAHPKYINGLILKADLLEQLGKDSASGEILQTAYKIDNRDSRLVQKLAQRYMSSDKPLSALALYRRLASIDTTDADFLAFVAEIEHKHGSLDSAALLYRKALAISPDDASIMMKYSDVLRDSKQNRMVEKILLQTIAEEPRDVSPRKKLAGFYSDVAQYKKAAKTYDQLHVLTGHTDYLEDKGRVLMKDDSYAEARAVFKTVMSRKPKDSDPAYYHCLCATRINDPDVESCWGSFIKKFPDDYRGFYQLGKIYTDKKEWSKATEFLDRALELKSYDYAMYYRALASYNLGQHTAALEYVSKFLEKKPGSARGESLKRRIERKK